MCDAFEQPLFDEPGKLESGDVDACSRRGGDEPRLAGGQVGNSRGSINERGHAAIVSPSRYICTDVLCGLQLASVAPLACSARQCDREVHRPLRLPGGSDEHADFSVMTHPAGRRAALYDRARRRKQIRTVDLLGIRHNEEVRAAVGTPSLDQNVRDSLMFADYENGPPSPIVSDLGADLTGRNLAMNPPTAGSQ